MRSGEGSTAAAAAAEEEKVKVAAPFRLAELGLRVCAVPLAVRRCGRWPPTSRWTRPTGRSGSPTSPASGKLTVCSVLLD